MTSIYEIQQDIKKFIVSGEKTNLSEQCYEELTIYKGLISNTISSLLENIYPFTYKLLKDDWKRLLAEYMEQHPPNSPVLNHAAKDFPLFLAKKIKEENLEPKYIAELAWYEWMELELFVAPGDKDAEEDSKQELRLTPVNFVCDFAYPITEIVEALKDEKLDIKPEPKAQQVLVFRDEESKQVRFFVLAPTTSLALKLIHEGTSFDEICKIVEESFQIPPEYKDKLVQDLNKLLDELKNKHILIQ